MVAVVAVLRLEVLMAQFLFLLFSAFDFWRVWPLPSLRKEKTDKCRRADKLALSSLFLTFSFRFQVFSFSFLLSPAI